MADRDLTTKSNMRKHLLHDQRRFHRLARAEMQKIDVQAIRFIGEVGGYPDCQPFGVRRTRRTVRLQSGKLALAFDNLCVSFENFGELAVQADADIRRLIRKFVHQTLGRAHDEFKVRYVVAIVRPNHEEFVLRRRAAV